MTMLQHGAVPSTGGGYQIERSLRFNSADSAYLSRTPGSAGDRQKWTISFWIKRSALGLRQEVIGNTDSSALNGLYIEFLADDTLQIGDYASAGWSWQFVTTQVFRDPSAWYHIVLSVDTTQATNTNRIKIYVNGTQVTAFGTATYPSQNFSSAWNTTQPASIGRNGQYTSLYFNGYLADVYNIGGQQLTPSSFGENDTDTGVWKPKAYSGTYGTNGFYLKFADNSGTTSTTLGKDSSGNGNNWTPNNFSVTAGAGNDSLVDTPTPYGTDTGVGGEVRGNYATWNPVWLAGTFANGNLDATTAAGDSAVGTTFGMSSGKWYAEMLITRSFGTTGTGSAYITVGLIPSNMPSATTNGYTSNSYGYYSQTGYKYNNSSGSAYGASYDVNDIIGIAFDADAGTLTFYKNGVSQGTAFSSIPAGTYFFAIGEGASAATSSATLNAGQRPFAYTAPSGFKALCTTNLPTPAIGATSTTRADDYFNTVLYTGTGSAPKAITGVGFSPDFVWTKSRSNATNNGLVDSVRGGTKALISDLTDAEYTGTYINSFDSDGYTIGDTGSSFNLNNYTYVSWNWRGSDSSAVSNTQGTITSTVSANTTSGFSIVTFTAQTSGTATVGHGLGAAPSMIITKSRGSAGSWTTYHSALGNTKLIYLNLTNAAATDGTVWNNTTPTSSVFTLGTGFANAGSLLAYCFAPVAGYSAFGSYTGNGSIDGPFVYTGFRPRFVLIKNAVASNANWIIWDAARNTYNVVTNVLFPNLSNAEASDSNLNFLSNGFKFINDTGGGVNTNGTSYIYAAFAEHPFKYALAR